MSEWVGANFNHSGKVINRSKKIKKVIYDANNARNRDSYSVTKSNNMLKEEKEIKDSATKTTNLNEVEDVQILIIDLKNEFKKKS